MRGEWIEIFLHAANMFFCWSLPMRGEWIEIGERENIEELDEVSPHAGRVD